MRVGILGPLQVTAGGTAGDTAGHEESVEIGGARLRALLIRLALDARRVVTAESLSSALWPEDMPDDPANALHSLVSRLRAALPAKQVLRSVPGGYQLDISPDNVDALRFERLAREGRRALRDGEERLASDRLTEALGLWRGAALANVSHVPYAAAAAVRLEELRLAATEDRVEADLATGAEHLVPELEELTAAHPLRERLRGLLVKALYADGRHAEALAAYEEYRRLLADELGVDPGPELREAHLAVLRAEPAPGAPGRRHRERPRGNLPTALTSFVGRTDERQLIAEQMRQGRLVTLVGPGGAGKSRLATTFAAGMADEVPGGVWLVELAPVTDPDDVPQAVVGALGVRDLGLPDAGGAPRDTTSRLIEALSTIETLLVLDNCEHLIDAVARFADTMLGRCPRLRILATSREPLGILGEALCPVSPLTVPEPGASAEQAAASPAVRLFADRARAVRPGFAVDDENVAAVAEICRRLDGLPLAIELAAARLRTMALAQLAARLEDRFRLLTGGSRTALPRHRTLRAVVAWSWDLLAADERQAADRLAVFPASFIAEAAEHLGVPVDILDTLVDKSLLQVVDGPVPRYRMLETIREYAVERLAGGGGLGEAQAAHAAYFRSLAERAEPWLRGYRQLPWIATLTAERDNLLSALHYARDAGDTDTAVRLGAALSYFWTIEGDHTEAANRLRAVLELSGDAPVGARLAATVGYLFNALMSGRPADAEVVAAQPYEPGAEDPAAAMIEALLALAANQPAAGRAAIDRWLHHQDPWKRAMLWLIRSMLNGSHGDWLEMRRDLVSAAENFREAGERWGLAFSLTYLGVTHSTLGDFSEAVRALEEAMGLVRELGTDDFQRIWLAMVRMHTGDVDKARAELRGVVAEATSTSYRVMARVYLADLARHDDDLDRAARQLEEAARDLGLEAHGAGSTRPAAYAASGDPMFEVAVGQFAVAAGDLVAARAHLREALALATGMPDLPLAAKVGVAVAQLCLRRGAARTAAETLGAAHTLRGVADVHDPDVVRLTRRLRDELGDRAYRAAYDRGRDLGPAGALAVLEAQVAAASERAGVRPGSAG